MIASAALGFMLVAPAAGPVKVAQPPAVVTEAEKASARDFAGAVVTLANRVSERYYKPVKINALIEASVRGLYEECGLKAPQDVLKGIRDADGAGMLVDLLAAVRLSLKGQPALRGPRAHFAAMNAFRNATDYSSRLVIPWGTHSRGILLDFGIGLELEGATESRLLLYQVEYRTASGQLAPTGWLEPPPKEVPAPISLPWRVSRVVPDSPAQKAGIKPGDIITHYDGDEITADNANKLFAQFAIPRFSRDTGIQAYKLKFRRDGTQPFSATLKGEKYTEGAVFGVMRTDEDKWDCVLDRKHKIGYVRITGTNEEVDTRVGEMLAELDKKGCRGLILDLRWCPGGYVDPAYRVAGMFLKEGALLGQLKSRNPAEDGEPEIKSNYNGPRYPNYPIVVLIGNETAGTAELIASALCDNDRAVLMGQRTAGRGAMQHVVNAGFGDLQYQVTVGIAFRPNGKARHRFPDSGPLDDWGIKPDEGLEIPITKDKCAELRLWAELHSLRSFESNEALDFDDPSQDPYRAKALDYLRKKLGKPNAMK